MTYRNDDQEERIPPLVVGIDEAARLLSLSPHTIRKYEREGRIRATRLGRRVLFPMEEIHRIIREGCNSPSSNN